jgi:DNA-nicking Smr family endonuclease
MRKAGSYDGPLCYNTVIKGERIMAVKKREPETYLNQPFEGLRDIIKTRGIDFTPRPPGKKKSEPLTDEELFAKAMDGVKEIKEFRHMRTSRKKVSPPARREVSDSDALQTLREIVSGRAAVNLAHTQEYVEWINEDFKGDFTKLLHEGRLSVKDCLDLHGLTSEEAGEAVALFFRESKRKGHKCLKIIHGRGLRSPRGPVLKGALIKHLSGRYRKHIIAFVTARQCDGGLGALYVLLR